MYQIGDVHEIDFSFTQDEVNEFCKISGDFNPLHWDEVYASKTQFKQPIIHGALIASIVYLKQITEFKRPLIVGLTYRAKFQIESINKEKHIAEVKTQVYDRERGKLMVDGMATALHLDKF